MYCKYNNKVVYEINNLQSTTCGKITCNKYLNVVSRDQVAFAKE